MCSDGLSGLMVALTTRTLSGNITIHVRICSDLLSSELTNSGHSQWSKVDADVLKKGLWPELNT